MLDVGDFTPDIKKIRQLLESDGTIVKDIHIWQISENERSLIVSLQTDTNKTPKDYHNMIKELSYFEHITVEVNNETRITKNAKPAFFKTEQLARV